MWPFTRKEDWEKTPEELNADVQRIAAAGRADVQRQLGAAETGANMTAQGRELWLGTPPDQRADLGLPPGSAPAVDYANTRPPGSTVASIPNTPPPGATPTTDLSRPPPGMSNRPGGMVAELLGNANSMNFTRNDQGQIIQTTKHIHDLGPAPRSDASERVPGAGPMRIGTTPESVYDTLLNNPVPGSVSPVSGMPPGSVPTSLPANPPSRSITDAQLDAAVQRERQYNADQTARTAEWNRTMAANRTPSGMTQEAWQRQKDKTARDQLQREQMASGERIAKSNAEAMAAKVNIPVQADNARTAQELQNRKDIAGMDIASREKISKEDNTRRLEEANLKGQQNVDKYMKKVEDRVLKEENKNYSFFGVPEKIGDYYNRTYDENHQLRPGVVIDPAREDMIDRLVEDRAVLGKQERYLRVRPDQANTQGGTVAPAGTAATAKPETPPRPGANKAPDGKWYIPDPNRAGKYLQVT